MSEYRDGKESINKDKKPHPRQNTGKIQKTIILVTGKPNIGKTTLCATLVEQSQKIGYLSFDSIADNLEWCKIKQLHDFRKTLEYPSHMIDKVNEFIDHGYARQFVRNAFKEFIQFNSNDYLLIDGHFFSLKNNYFEFVKRCHKYDYRLWLVDRVL